ncbi:hypothetical protein IO99_17950 [Clostridium sulfidigenes]|uniref:Zinc finger CHC2-type domain-containing protein n=1 Tax=Clostridium sulfidigenes TaxID=318464 RepID=A0A084J7F2_9CLOT|nr:VapE domain-containing protein [Clostridium sulfidigenes]KEZ84886.1 hypothetical protein IO99_17950 [Clostridium sulfidigenes]
MITKEEINLKDLIENESSKKFDRNNKMCCPFHGEKTPSFTIKKYDDKYRYYCFGCGRHGDAIDFIKEYKNINYNAACEYLNIEPSEDYSKKVALIEKVEKAIHKISFKDVMGNPLNYVCLYMFVDKFNDPLYFKAKFKDINNKSTNRYFSINNNKVMCNRGTDEVPYNLYKLLEGIKKDKYIIILEGEKDVDTLSYMGYIATSLKDVTKFDYSIFQDCKIYIVPDTGQAGEKYKDDIYYKIKDYVKEFNVIYPEGLKDLGDNKDITDWFQSGKTIDDFKAALKDKWDYKKNKNFKYVNSNGSPLVIWENFQRICELNNITIKYNELSKKIEFNSRIFKIVNDEACFEDLYSLCIVSNFKVSKQNLRGFVFRLSQENSYNPAKDYFEACYKNWDHKEGRILELSNTIISSKDYDDKLKYMLLKRWLIGTANIAFNDGAKNMNGVLVIQGGQGIGKTRWIKTLLPNSNWIDTDKYINPKKVDDVVDVTSALIVELGELKTSLTRDKVDTLKMFFTRCNDRYRRPYAIKLEEYPRVTSFYATVNNSEFLEDDTGNRRYWCIRVEKMIVDHNVDINQLWGEVMYLLRYKKEPHWLSKDEEQQLYTSNSEFEVKTDADTKIMDMLDWSFPKEKWVYTTFSEICSYLGLKSNSSTRNSLKKLGAIPPPKDAFRVNGILKRWWKVPPLSGVVSLEYTHPINEVQAHEPIYKGVQVCNSIKL